MVQQSTLPSRLYSLDIARALASLCVVIWHWQHFFFQGEHLLSSYQTTRQPFYWAMQLIYLRGGGLAVFFFFVLSGFVFFWLYQNPISRAHCTFVKFVTLRFARLYPLHLLTLFLVCLLQIAFWNQHKTYFVYPFNDLYHFLLQLGFISHWGFEHGGSFNGPIWSVSIEMGLYLIFFGVVYTGQSQWWKLMIIAIGGLVLHRQGIAGHWTLPIAAFFTGGLTYAAVQNYLQFRNASTDAAIILGCALLWISMCVSFRVMHHMTSDRFYFFIWLLCPLTIWALVIVDLLFAAQIKPWGWIGDLTYSMYLLHFPLQLVFVLATDSLGWSRDVYYEPASMVTFLLILIGLSLITYRYFELPLQKLLRKRLFTVR